MRQRTLVAVSAVLVAVGTATLVAQSKLADFGIREADVKANTVSAFIDGNPSIYPSRKAFNGASPSVRAAFVRNTLAVVKSYTETATFQAEYAKQRASARPSAPASKGSPDEQYAKYLAERQKSIADMKASVAKMSPDMQKQMLPMVKQMEEAYAQQAKNPQMVAIMKQGFVAQGQASQKEYQNSLAQYESKYPADPKVLIASRLHQFLD
ncbi:MAG TPA: hypothetical protein VG897_02435, partial [Terriglobales bacterium]|nr:hypothetical protein [Terriglobales bacterium]